MKKLIFSFLFLVIAGFAAQTPPVHAAASPSAASVLGAEEIKVLTQALGALKIVLEDMQALITSAPSPILNSAELNTGLEAIRGNLTLINATIESQALVYSNRVGETQIAALQAPVVAPKVSIKESAPLLREETPVIEQTAVLTSSVNQRNILWVAVGLLAIALGLVFWQWRKKMELKVTRVAVQDPQTPIVPMIREDNIQGIPPDY